uniref:Fanconi anemia group E protein isoform X1 n=1 Tax=Doryrhamphus excisus TaxID=161450 RepID=UPI0025AE8050|nr:Fanconi anemia group E protein isoform X1 [Doryrhamphus excisus]
MNTEHSLSRFDEQSKLLVRSLLCGDSGASTAGWLDVFRRQQRTLPELSWPNLLATLCRDEVIWHGKDDPPLTTEALVYLFPALWKQNLLTVIHLIHSCVPKASVLRLLQRLSQDDSPGSWVTALTRQLERNLGCPCEEHLYTQACHRRLEELSRRLDGETAGWAECFSIQTEESQAAPWLSDFGTQRKRKGDLDILDSDEDRQQSKRVRMDDGSGVHEGEKAASEVMLEELDTQAGAQENTHPLPDHRKGGAPSEVPAQESSHDFLPEHIKVSAVQIKELLDGQTEWDQSSTEAFQLLNNCDTKQVPMLCSTLGLSDLAEQTLPKVCRSILALSPDLSFSTAAALIKSLLLQKVLSLSEPASRSLLTVVMSLCSRYTRSMCHALIEPVLAVESLGGAQAELLKKLIEGCLHSHYTLLVLQMTLRMSWSEPVLSVIHSLLDSEPDMNEELFTQLTAQLVRQGPRFTKSVNFAKLLLTILTKYGSTMNASNKKDLSGCLMIHGTFLKKSLQAALKRIP